MAFVVKGIVKGVSTSIGLAAEKYYDHKDRKTALALQSNSGTTANEHVVGDEQDWALDEAADPPIYELSVVATSNASISELVHNTMPAPSLGPSPTPPSGEPPRLPYPIVIPQRRPGTKARGFARAYPPDLANLGIDHQVFLRFLKNFQNAAQASPFLRAIFVSAGVVGLVPGVITMTVSISVQIVASAAIELQGRYKANTFLDQMNKELFMPLGLYAMVLVYKPDGPGTETAPAYGLETINFETAKQISKWGPSEQPTSTSSKFVRPIREVSGKTKGEAMMPLEVARLIYPGLDQMIDRPNVARDESFKDRVQRNKKFVAEYFDRRAAATYTGNNPDTLLARSTSQYQFRSRFADPNHAVNSGTPIALLTGGKLIGRSSARGVREVGADGKLLPEAQPEAQPELKEAVKQGLPGLIGYGVHGVKKAFGSNILYLTIVNMPSEEELAEAKKLLEQDKKGLGDLLKASREWKT